MSATAFDRIAARYDQLWTSTPVGRAQRQQVWREIDPLFRAGDRILYIGCGTGEDAAHFAARGISVRATDASAAMVREASRRGGFDTAVARAEEIVAVPGSYDGAISNFGALNCVADLSTVARGLGEAVRPGGCVAICVIGRFCLWETLYYVARLQFRKAFRRRIGSAPSSMGTVYYSSVAHLQTVFAPHFQCERWTGIGLIVPPSYVHLPPALVHFFSLLDRAACRLPFLRALTDHRLLILVRK